ncbi:Nucleoside triphosphate pyrophosphohydrolase MazG [hydrothermal vent metagenome]|uniref:Nucleoside triphosphate pyrophosphohydrolase MazG n=1 Tax=hydrothermal vent metagenome TaxID=652676 RepID=A0A3B1BTN0_9ZZZZ
MKELLDIMACLREPDTGCPWDRKQTFATIAPYTIEEAYEVADAIERGDMDELREELGDLLFQVVFYAQMAKEIEAFEFADVVTAVCDKMRRRHPHVFGDVVIKCAEEQTRAWEQQKHIERQSKTEDKGHSLLDGVASAMPALMRAEKLQRRAARGGFDWPDVSGVFAKIHEELNEVTVELAKSDNQERITDEIGDLLFACANLARHAGVDAEMALAAGNRKFERRFRQVEEQIAAQGERMENLSLDELESYWQAVKLEER